MNDRNDKFKDSQLLVEGVPFNHQDLFVVVDDFYSRVQEDPELKIPFQSVGDWPEHIDRLTHFWWIRFGGQPYMLNQYNPALKHFFSGFNEALLKRWLWLFHQTLDDHLSQEQANLWKQISERMGKALLQKNEFLKSRFHEGQGR